MGNVLIEPNLASAARRLNCCAGFSIAVSGGILRGKSVVILTECDQGSGGL